MSNYDRFCEHGTYLGRYCEHCERLVERLRGYPGASLEQLMGEVYQRSYAGLSKEAADKIERLESRLRDRQNALDHAIGYGHRMDGKIERLRDALERIEQLDERMAPITNTVRAKEIAREALREVFDE